MGRALDSTFGAEIVKPVFAPCFLAILTFASATRYVWTGIGDLSFGGHTYIGVGSLGSIGGVNEGLGVQADGTSVTLSGIDPIYLAESMTDIQLGAPAELYFGAVNLATGLLQGAPYRIFRGVVDQPAVDLGGETVSITLALENRLIDLQRAQSQRYTSTDQRLNYPTDMFFDWVEILQSIALREGT